MTLIHDDQIKEIRSEQRSQTGYRIIVFFLTGLWHGANWTFVLWGLYHGFFLLLETYFPFTKKIPRWLGHIYAVLVVCVGFVMFRAETVGQGFLMIGKMFTGFSANAGAASLFMQQMTPWFITMFITAVFACAPVRAVRKRLFGENVTGRAAAVRETALYILAFALLAWCIIRLSGASYNPFIYFRF